MLIDVYHFPNLPIDHKATGHLSFGPDHWYQCKNGFVHKSIISQKESDFVQKSIVPQKDSDFTQKSRIS